MTTSRMKKCSVDGFFNGALCGSLLAGEYLECGLPDGISCCYQQTVKRPEVTPVPTPAPVPVKVIKKVLEKHVETHLYKRMKKLGGECYKWQSINQRGVTDRICVFPPKTNDGKGLTCFVELKRDDKCKLSGIQVKFHNRMDELRVPNVYVLHGKEEVDLWLKSMGY